MTARTLHLTAIAVLVLAPLASVIGWGPLLIWILIGGFALLLALVATVPGNIIAWLDGLEAEGL